MSGEFGDVQFSARTAGERLFINPLMAMYWSFDAGAVARRSLYLASLETTETMFQVSALIDEFRRRVEARPHQAIPH